jgi:hypothetical protein
MLSKLTFAVSASLASQMSLSDLRSDEFARSVNPIVQGLIPKGCRAPVNRLKQGPEVWEDIIEAGELYTDNDFKKKDMLYQWPVNGFWLPFTYDTQLFFGGLEWVRLGETYEDNTMWGADGVDFAGPEQGQLGNCYILAAMGAVAEYPEVI